MIPPLCPFEHTPLELAIIPSPRADMPNVPRGRGDAAAHILDNEFKAYEALKPQLTENHHGKFVVLNNGQLMADP